MSNKFVLVTGGAGYIGSHTCKQLHGAGYTPVVYDNLSRGHAEFVKWGPLEVGDLANPARILEVLEKYEPDAVLHFAAFGYVGESVIDPLSYYTNNVAGTLNLLQMMEKAQVKKLVFSSSCAVFGIPQIIPIPDTHPQSPINPYGRTKSIIETVLQDMSTAYGLRSISLRYFNAAGADPDGEIGEHHEPETHIIPLIFDAAIGRRNHVVIFGDDYPTTDGTCIRDYIHVEDLAKAHLLALQALDNGHPTASYNLSNGQGYSIRNIITSAEQITGRKIPYVIGPRRPGDPDELIGDSTNARTVLGWCRQYTTLEEILAHAWKWHQQRFSSS